MLGIHVPHARELTPGTFVRRFKRFFAEVDLGRERVLAHCANTGRMEGMLNPGARVHLLREPNPKRKLLYTWELVEVDGVVLGANPARANRLVRAALEAGQLPGLARFSELESERAYGDSRADFWLRIGRREAFVEVKNAHLVYPDRRAYFPDAPSARALRHLRELECVARRGDIAAVIFVVQRSGAKSVRPSDVHDPDFAEGARRAKRPYSLGVVRRWQDSGACGAPVLSR
jgi:sugar fermentation stimulation protein A